MNAAPADQLRLLDLADLDARLRQSEHARSNPPQAARVAELLATRRTVSQELSQRQSDLDELRTELSRIEADVAVVQARRERDEALLQKVTNPKDATGIEHELASLQRRQSDLEDAELEVMEKLEVAEAAASEKETELAAIGDEGARLSAEAKALVAETTARIEQLQRDREAVAAGIPAELVAMYDRLTSRSAGAALLRARTCTSCHMVLSGTDLAALRQLTPDTVATCPECGSILVRTAESGL